MSFVGNLRYFAFQEWTNFGNPLKIDKVIAMSLVYCLFGTQCSYWTLVLVELSYSNDINSYQWLLVRISTVYPYRHSLIGRMHILAKTTVSRCRRNITQIHMSTSMKRIIYLVIYLVWQHQSCWSTCAAIGLVGLHFNPQRNPSQIASVTADHSWNCLRYLRSQYDGPTVPPVD